jgi:hypothetical protein
MPQPSDLRTQLATAQQERREAIYEAREAHGDRPSEVPDPPRDKLPTLDDLTGPNAPRARWQLILAAAAGLSALGELARQIIGLVKH